MHFFGRLSFLVDENAHAVHFFVSALLQLLDRYVTALMAWLYHTNRLLFYLTVSRIAIVSIYPHGNVHTRRCRLWSVQVAPYCFANCEAAVHAWQGFTAAVRLCIVAQCVPPCSFLEGYTSTLHTDAAKVMSLAHSYSMPDMKPCKGFAH